MTSPVHVRIGSLRKDDYFSTIHTHRSGFVLAPGGETTKDLMGVPCALDGPDEEKRLHPDVMVLPERV